MDLISSSAFLEKYVWGPIVVMLGIAILVWYRSEMSSDPIGIFDIIVYVTVPISVFHFIYRYWSSIDKVWDSGNSLIFMKNGKEVEIPYSQIKSFKINEKEYENHSKKEFFVKVDLGVKIKWGKTFKFMPATEGNVGRKPIEKIYEIEATINNSKN